MAFLPRELTERIKASSEGRVCLIAGPRQVGKSSLAAWLFKNRNAAIVSGDHPLTPAFLEDPVFLASLNGKDCLLIDEVQRIRNFASFLNRVGAGKIGCPIYTTASSEEVARKIYAAASGCCRVFHLLPLSLRERAAFSSWEKALELIPKRLVFGSYPEVAANPGKEEKVLGRIIELHLLKDVLMGGEVRNRTALLRLLKILALKMGCEITFEALSREARLSKTTLIRYLRGLEDSYIIKILPSFSKRQPSELRKGKKIYFFDLGIRNAILEDFRPLE